MTKPRYQLIPRDNPPGWLLWDHEENRSQGTFEPENKENGLRQEKNFNKGEQEWIKLS